jgi:hypothetical protein
MSCSNASFARGRRRLKRERQHHGQDKHDTHKHCGQPGKDIEPACRERNSVFYHEFGPKQLVYHHRNLCRRYDQYNERSNTCKKPHSRHKERRLCRQQRRRDDSDEVSYHRQTGARDADYQTDERHHGVEDSERPVREERAVERETSVSCE